MKTSLAKSISTKKLSGKICMDFIHRARTKHLMYKMNNINRFKIIVLEYIYIYLFFRDTMLL